MAHETPLSRHLEICDQCLQGLSDKLCPSGQQLANEAAGLSDAKPWLERDWRMIRQYRLDYPDGDKTKKPHKVEIFPLFLERESETKFIRWAWSLYGPVGTSGELTPQAIAKLEPVTRRKDKARLNEFISTLERANKIGQTVAESALNVKNNGGNKA